MSEPKQHFDTVIVGAGNAGIAVAYYLAVNHGVTNVAIVDERQPLSYTSAQSGENYRNWWPNGVMASFTNHSIDLLEEVARASGDRIKMTRRGYALVTRRSHPEDLIAELTHSFGQSSDGLIRFVDGDTSGYRSPDVDDWRTAPAGVDVITNRDLIRKTFPGYADDVATVLHIRRGGSISGQQLGQFMLETATAAGARLLPGKVVGIEAAGSGFRLSVAKGERTMTIAADRIVNSAGPFVGEIGAMLGEKLPVSNIYHQKISFEDNAGAIDRRMPFTIDLDPQQLAWTDEEKAILAEDPATARLLEGMPGAIHCRPDGAESGKWIKLGWAYNHDVGDPHGEEPRDPQFPDTVVRGASRLHPKLAGYLGRLPRGTHHYGGYYTMTNENWPLIGPMATPGAYIAGALSGFGTMAACATGALCAAWITGNAIPDYAGVLSLGRYDDAELMSRLAEDKKGHL
ncbi:FAD-binding oxidoreductase (plasmid) [Bosea sp. F3-2]|uniref:NAD(P)/FAD-dependent oxidoreductase n=1 Tax=Bosea sp. F3-2 TaxID=2599640 RepID=UPI0011ECEE68|nr:FAD-binding oxidoreductase [Bosea sp. F3-2]QEL27358.1 FAD-binding oxidoreductase [Bosea sp. F3-2]